MRSPLFSLLVSIGLAIFAGAILSPTDGSKAVIGPQGQIMRGADGRMLRTSTKFGDLRVNWPAYLCFALAAAAFIWTLVLITLGLISLRRPQDHDAA